MQMPKWPKGPKGNDSSFAKRYFLALLTSITLSASGSVTLTGCGNNFRGISSNSLSTTSGTSGTTGVTGTSGRDSFIISSVAITTPSSGGSGSSGGTGATTGGTVGAARSTTGIFFNTTQSTTTINSHCNTADTSGNSTSKPCLCQFTWNETNPNSPNNLPVTRSVQTSVSTVQPSFIGCSAPDVYSTEIPAGTGIRVTVLAAPGNSDLGTFTVNSYVFKVPTSTIGGAFSDGAGNIFDNILHYSCYGKNQKGLTITSKSRTVTSPSTGATATALYGTKFCIASSSGGGGSSSCTNPPADYSAQSYYFNLFVRSTEKGDINQFNSSFICPLVRESLHNTNTIGTQNQPWPLDQSFALSTTPTSVFAVGVQANIKLSGGADPTAVANTCFPTEGSGSGGGSSNTNSIINACLGFAARPNTNGTCPSISDSTGRLRPTYRLRRYLGIYPMLFDTTGIPLSTPQSVDTIYVLDRPVTAPATANPLQPYTMLGPKPCPFAFFDTKNVTGLSKPQYHGTSDSAWSGKNFDGIEFPNRDNAESCSASLPILSDDGSMFSISTVNLFNDLSTGALRHVWVRPQQPFFPHYEEDTNFLACAPQASPVYDPPLHFSRDPYSGNVAWCSESYPTQNPNVGALDPPDSSFNASGNVVPYTSHVVKRTTNAPCTPSVVNVVSTSTYTYPGAGAASHPNTITMDPDPDASLPAGSLKADKSCDRTATSAGLAWPRFPLLAPASAVETSINTDKSYFCTVTYDAGGGKQGLSTPAGGCCNSGIVQVTTGTQGGSTAHLEPTVACGQPQY